MVAVISLFKTSNRIARSLHSRALSACAAVALVLVPPSAIGAQLAFPDGKPIKLVVPYGAGGTADVTARMVAERMSTSLSVPVVLDFRPGGNLIVGSVAAASAAADGYTLFLGSGTSQAINPLLRSNLPYSPTSFAAVSGINTSAYVIAVPADSPARSLADLIALAKSKPRQLTYGSFGAGNVTHLAFEMLTHEAGVSMSHVPYKGSAQAEIDLITGRIDALLTTFTVMSHVKDGNARVLAVTTGQRSPLLPDVPTIAESGYPDYEVTGWFALFVPAGTPPAVIDLLNAEVRKALADPLVRERYEALGMIAGPSSSAEVDQRIAKEGPRWQRIIEQLGIKDTF